MSTDLMQAEIAENVAMIAQQHALNGMLARSATDAQFRALMLSDAHAAFAAAGVEVSAALDIVFIENKADVTIVLPEALGEMMELSEDELTSFNGGSIAIVPIIEATVELSSLSSPACAGAVISVGAVALTIYLAKS
jgi:hypothetical protein